MKKLLLTLLAINAISATAGTLKLEYGTIAPFNAEDMTIAEFIKEYAELKDVMVTSPSTEKLQEKVNIITYSPITLDRLDDYFEQVLSNIDCYAHRTNEIIEILPLRLGKYLTDKFYTSDNFPVKREYISVVHKLKYPVAKLIERTLRGTLSRNGRVYTFHGNRILIKDYGTKIETMISIINEIDTKEAFDSYRKRLEEKAKNKSKNKPENESKKAEQTKPQTLKGAKNV